MIALDHVNIRVRNQEAVRDFLILVLGVKAGFRPPFDFPGYWLYLNDQPIIHLMDNAHEVGYGWCDHVAFGPFNYEQQIAKLDKAGLDYRVTGIPGEGIRQIFVHGPEGVKLELQCPDNAVGLS